MSNLSFNQKVQDYYWAAKVAGKIGKHERMLYVKDQIIANKENVFPLSGELTGKKLWFAIEDALQNI